MKSGKWRISKTMKSGKWIITATEITCPYCEESMDDKHSSFMIGQDSQLKAGQVVQCHCCGQHYMVPQIKGIT